MSIYINNFINNINHSLFAKLWFMFYYFKNTLFYIIIN